MRLTPHSLFVNATVEPWHDENSPPFVIARRRAGNLFRGGKEDATVEPWHDEKGSGGLVLAW